MPEQLQKAGVLDLKQVQLCVLNNTGIKSQVDVKDQVAMFSLVQDLFSSSIQATFTMSDSTGNITRFNKSGYQGQEFISLRCKKPGSDEKLIDLQFWIYDVSEISGSFKNDSSTYTLSGITKEKLIDVYSDVNQSFNSSYSDAAVSIFDNYIKNDSRNKKLFKSYSGFAFKPRSLEVHESRVENQFIIPGKQPFDAIDFCARRCLGRKGSNSKASSIFLFYENINGYYFHCLDDLINDGKRNVTSDLTFEYEPMKKDNDGKRFDRKIRDLSSVKTSDNLVNANGGVFKNSVLIVDPVGKTFSRKVFDYNIKFNDLQHLNEKQLIDNEYITEFTRPTYEHLFLKDTTKKNQHFDQILNFGIPYIVQLHNLQIQMSIEGDTSIVPGQVIFLKVPEMSAITDKPLERSSTKFSGYWLVTNVVHEYTRDSFLTTLTVMKDSISEALGEIK